MTNTFSPEIPDDTGAAHLESSRSSNTLLANLLADLTGWIGCAWAAVISYSGKELAPIHICGALPNVSACTNFIGLTLESAGTISDGTVVRLTRGALYAWMPEFVTVVTIHGSSYVLAFGPKKGGSEYNESDVQLILDAARQLSTLLDRNRLAEAIAAKIEAIQEVRLDLARARDVQSRMFPLSLPRIAGLDYYGECRQAAEVGGDFFDFVPLENKRLAASAGDVSGHGVSAAILMSGLQAYLRSFTNESPADPVEVIHRLNRTVYDISPDNFFATLFYAQVDPSCGLLEYVNAGHEPALLVRGRGVIERLDATGTVLGLSPEAHFERKRVAVRPGDILVAFTDGITEATDIDGRALREAGVVNVIQHHSDERATDLVWRIEEAADRYCVHQDDDRTVIVVRFTGTGETWPACSAETHAFAA